MTIKKLAKRTAAAVIGAAIILTMYSCNKAGESSDKPQENQGTDSKAEKEESFGWAAIPQYPDAYPTQEDIVNVYKTACTAFGWFALTETPPVDDSVTYDNDGIIYFKVKSDEVTSLKALEVYLGTMFDADITDMLMDLNKDISRFIEDENGVLYCTNFSYKPTGFSETETYSTVKNSDEDYTFSVNYDALNEDGSVKANRTETYEYKKTDGRWVFTKFRVFRQ